MKKQRLTFAKRVVSTVACAALAFSLVPAQAFALGEITQWSPPGKTDTSYVKDGKTYTYITSAAHRRTEAVADYLGISNVTVQPMRTGKAFPYKEAAQEAYDIAAKTGRMGIFGTEVNEKLNPYYGNFFYNINQDLTGGTDKAGSDEVLVFSLENNGPMNADTDIIDEYGTSASLYLRPDILFGAGTIKEGEETVTVGAHSKTTSGYSELVNKIRNGELGEYEGVSLAKEGDADYDPYYVAMSVATTNREDINMLYDLATAAENIMDATKDTDHPKVTRYGDPMEIAQLYEEWILGTQMAVLKAIDDKKTTRKTVGVISAIDEEAGQVTFAETGKGNFEFLQEVCDNISVKNGLEGGVGAAKDIMDCSAVFLSSAAQKDKIITILKSNGYTDENAYPDIYTTGPDAVLNLQHECEANMAYGFLLGFAYPEVINPVDAVAFYYRNFYHIKEGSLADALGMQISNMSLPAGVELNINDFSEKDFRAMLDEAVLYWNDNKAAMQEAHPTIEPSDNFEMPQKPSDPDTPDTPSAQPADQSITGVKASYSKTFGDSSFSLGAKASTKLSYKSSNAKVASVDASGRVTVKGAGSATITVSAAATKQYKAASKAVKVSVAKAPQKVSAKNVSKTYKGKKEVKSKKLKKAQTIKLKASAKTKVTFKKTGKAGGSKIKVSKSGKVTVKKGLKAGTYRVKVKATAAAGANYKSASKTITVKVVVKKK